MPCYHPKYAIIPHWAKDDHRPKFISEAAYKAAMLEPDVDLNRFAVIPCGKCQGCLDDKARQWANRLLLESEYYDPGSVWFVTLTYNDQFLPLKPFIDQSTGERIGEVATLDKSAPSAFMKRLRNYFPGCNLRFFAAGEYGSTTKRPHYHLIIFGMLLQDDELTVYKRTPLGFTLYNCERVQRAWRVQDNVNGKLCYYDLGYVVIAPATWETMCYTARYVAKKADGEDRQYWIDHCLEPEFNVMSRRPGIAYQWYVDHPGVIDQEWIFEKTPNGGKKFRPPKYFDRLFEKEEPVAVHSRSLDKRKKSFESRIATERRTSKPYKEYLESVEYNHSKAQKVLKNFRNGV